MTDRPSATRPPRDVSAFAGSLLELNRVEGDERRILFRQAIAALAQEGLDGPGPLEGIHPGALTRGVQAALDAGLLDDLDWLAPPAAGRALFSLASALPLCSAQRELGRRALSRLLEGDAETFAAMATVMAKTGSKALASPPVIARASLLFELPIQAGIPDGALAFTLVSRKPLMQTWIANPSTRSLSARRLAARIIERAAREAATRAAQSDTSYLRAFAVDAPLAPIVARLLEDRESLVWRHAAVARGLIAASRPDLVELIQEGISPSLTPTEWRRAATSIAAHAAVRPEAALRLTVQLFDSEVAKKDPGVAGPFLWGLARAAETEPEAAAEMFALSLGGPAEDIADAVVYLRRELGPCAFLEAIERRSLERLVSTPVGRQSDDGAVALKGELLRDLEGRVDAAGSSEDEPVRSQIERTLSLFVAEGARVAHGKGLEVLAHAHSTVDALLAMSQGAETPISRRASVAVLRDVDLSLLERDVCGDLLRLDTNVERAKIHDEALGALRSRTAKWILDREAASDEESGQAAEPAHLVLRLSRLRALLHLVDSDSVGAMREPTALADDASRVAERDRWQTIAHALLTRVEARPSKALRRALLATLARSLDALVRTQACDVVDALLVVASKMSDPRDFETLTEASMDPDLRHVLGAYAMFLRAGQPTETAGTDSLFPESAVEDGRLAGLEALADSMISVGSYRSDALRSVLSRLGKCLSALARASSLQALANPSGEPEIVVTVEASALALQQMCAGAKSRIFELTEVTLTRASASRALSTAVARVLSGGDEELDAESLSLSATNLTVGIPRAIGGIVETILQHLGGLPPEGSMLPETPALAEQLPAWLPARRVLGAFYVLRALSSGGAGSVFVVCRTEDRREKSAERFALKVPDYSANAARHLSETQFFQLFREEASALMALPHHPNLARFVTFDLASRPRPILVMELVEGASLERVIEARTLDVPRAFRALDQVLAGLEVMHAVGVGHLDVKPSNVVLRGATPASMRASASQINLDALPEETAVLVDFGLAGRHIRPGCASGPYGAPEVWGAVPEDVKPTPMAADVYAFGCLAFEALTGDALFDAESEVALIASHIAHDGLPLKLKPYTKAPHLQPLAELLFGALRRDPRSRVGVTELRSELKKLRGKLGSSPWPLVPNT